jgi:hypothetical protein
VEIANKLFPFIGVDKSAVFPIKNPITLEQVGFRAKISPADLPYAKKILTSVVESHSS